MRRTFISAPEMKFSVYMEKETQISRRNEFHFGHFDRNEMDPAMKLISPKIRKIM